MGEDSHSFLQLNSKDAILFVYKKTIFDINNDYRKNYKLTEQETELFNIFKKETLLVNNILSLLIDNLEYNDIETYINSCIEELELFLQKVDFSKKDNKTYLNFLNNVLFFIDINKYQNISFKQSHQYILSFIKACVKKTLKLIH